MIKNIIFDLDETLVKTIAATERLFEDIQSRFQLPVEAEEFRKCFRQKILAFATSSGSPLNNHGLGSYDYFYGSEIEKFLSPEQKDYKQEILQATFDELGLEYSRSLGEQIAETLYQHWFEFFEAYEDIDLLDRFKEDYKLYMITDGAVDVQMKRVEHLGLKDYFDDIVVSQEALSSKPDPKVFHLLLERNDLKAEECIMVGDSYERDVLGAEGVGIVGVLISRSGAKSETPGRYIRNLYELFDILEDLNAR